MPMRSGAPYSAMTESRSHVEGNGSPLFRRTSLREPGGVAGHEVDFQVERVAGLALAPGGDRQGVRDDQDGKDVARHRVDGKRGAVEAHRALRGDEAGQGGGGADVEPRGRAPWVVPGRDRLAGNDGGEAVHVAGDDMAAEFVADLERALQVHARLRRPCADRRQGQGLGRRIHVEPAAAVAGSDRNHGEARPPAGDRGAKRDGRGIVRRLDAQPLQGALRTLRGDYLPHIGDDACEHQRILSKISSRSAPRSSVLARVKRSGKAAQSFGPRAGRPSSPRCVQERARAKVSTRSASASASPREGPPSLNTRVTPSVPSNVRVSRRSTRPDGAPTRITSAPAATNRRSGSIGAFSAAMIQVGTSAAVVMSWLPRGVRRRLSSTTRTGERCSRPGSRTVSIGSSAKTVPMPTMMTSWCARIRWVRAFEASPEMKRRGPAMRAA